MIFNRIDRIEGILYLIRSLVESYDLSNDFNDDDNLGVLYKVLLVYKIYRWLAYIGKSKVTVIYKYIFIENLD